MRLGLQFRDALHSVSPTLVAEFDQLVDTIRTSYLVEHDVDGRSRQVYVEGRLLTAQSLTSGTLTRLPIGRAHV